MSYLRVYAFANPAQAVRFDCIAPAGFRLLAAASDLARDWPTDIYLTSGTDGAHSGPNDPHKRGCAYDAQTNQWPLPDTKQAFVRAWVERAEGTGESAVSVGGGWGTTHFWGWVENLGQPNEHAHVQLRQGMSLP